MAQWKPLFARRLQEGVQSARKTRAQHHPRKTPEHIHLRFVPAAIPLIVERLRHPTLEMALIEDGLLDLTMAVAVGPERSGSVERVYLFRPGIY